MLCILTFLYNYLIQEYGRKNNTAPEYYSETNSRYQSQYFGIRISYQFGELKQQAVKKAQRTISNDDVKAVENSSGGR